MGVLGLEAILLASGRNFLLQAGSPRHPGCSSCFLYFCKSAHKHTWEKSKEEGKTGVVSRLLFDLCMPFCFWVGWLTESRLLLLLLLPLPPPLREIHIT